VRLALLASLMLVSSAARAEEGLWPIHRFPTAVEGFSPDQQWRDHVAAAAVEIVGCSAAVVSPDGLILTDRRCVSDCLARQAVIRRDAALFGQACRDRALRRGLPLFDLLYCARLDRAGQRQTERASFLAQRRQDEIKCLRNDINLRQLVSVQDVTERIKQAVARAPEKDREAAEREALQKVRRECSPGDRVWCNTFALHGGARYEVHKYRIVWDVRVVFSPEAAIAEFGAEGTGFTFPQHRFTAAFVRAYEDGKPLTGPHLTLAAAAPGPDDLLFMAGFAPETKRHSSVASVQLDRELHGWVLPFATELRGILQQYQKRLPIAARRELPELASLSRRRAVLDALTPEVMERREAVERSLRARIDADPRLRARYGQMWEEQRRAMSGFPDEHRAYLVIDRFGLGDLSDWARTLVRVADGPLDNRRAEAAWLLSSHRFDAGEETEGLAFMLRSLADEIGSHDPLTQKILQGRTPDEAAAQMVRRSRLPDVRFRRALVEGGRPAIDAADDPFIALWRAIDADALAARARYDREVRDPIDHTERQIRQARFEIFGTAEYPEGDGTLRLRWGHLAGFVAHGKPVPALVRLGDVFPLATGSKPFALPRTWTDARPRLDLQRPLAFAADTDPVIAPDRRDQDVGAPVFDKDLRLLGMVSGGNAPVAGSSFDYQPDARAVVLSSAAILEVLDKVYGAHALVEELSATGPPAAAGSTPPRGH
jgi:hypothetical protein